MRKFVSTFAESVAMLARRAFRVGFDESTCSSAARVFCSAEMLERVSLSEASRVSIDSSSSGVGISNSSFKLAKSDTKKSKAENRNVKNAKVEEKLRLQEI